MYEYSHFSQNYLKMISIIDDFTRLRSHYFMVVLIYSILIHGVKLCSLKVLERIAFDVSLGFEIDKIFCT